MVPTLITSFLPTQLLALFFLKERGNGYTQCRVGIEYQTLLVNTCLQHHMELAITFNEIFVINEKKYILNRFDRIFLKLKISKKDLKYYLFFNFFEPLQFQMDKAHG